MIKKIDNFFKISQRNSTFKTEILSGIIGFFSVVYILVVNPIILSEAGLDSSAVYTATIISAVVGTLIMALYANLPIIQAPGMGMNAFFTYTIVLAGGYTANEALFGIFISGILFIIVSATGIRKKLLNSIPSGIKYAIAVSVGYFIAFLGLKGSGIIVGNESTIVSLGDLGEPTAIITIICVIVFLGLHTFKIKGDVAITLIVASILGLALNVIEMPTEIFGAPKDMQSGLFLAFDDVNFIGLLTDVNFLLLLFSIFFLDFFDTSATLLAVQSQLNLTKEEEESNNALLSDAVATTVGALVGTSSVTTCSESLVSIKSGAQTGFSSIIVAFMFILSIFMYPIFSIFSNIGIVAFALIGVGVLMSTGKQNINFEDFIESTSAFFIIIFSLLTFSIAQGLSFGILIYVILKLFKGEFKDITPPLYFLSALMLIHFLV